jgi:hypothetical protein
MQVNIEQLIADLARKINACELTPHSPNLEADLRGTIVANEVKPAKPACPNCGGEFSHDWEACTIFQQSSKP